MRLGILTSHPIQYQAPWFRALAKEVDLEVFFAHRQSAAEQGKAGFGVAFDWDVDLLSGYQHRFLNNVSRNPGVNHFAGCDTPEIADIISGKLKAEKLKTEIPDSNFSLSACQPVSVSPFDAFIVTGWYLKSYLQAVRACRRLGVPVLVRGDSQLGTPRSPLKRLAMEVRQRWLLSQFDGFLSVGQRHREYLEHFGVPPKKIFFAPHFVDNEWFKGKAEIARKLKAEIRKRWNIPDDAFCVLFCGKFTSIKRPLDLVEAARLLISRISEGQQSEGSISAFCFQFSAFPAKLHLLFVGSGELGPQLRASTNVVFDADSPLRLDRGEPDATLAHRTSFSASDGEKVAKPDEVCPGSGEGQGVRALGEVSNSTPNPQIPHASLVGFKNQTELPACYVAADVLVLPSESETWGLVVNEAMACGLPAIVSDAVGCGPDLIEEGRTGFTFPVGDVKALSEKLQQIAAMRNHGEGFRPALAEKMRAYSVEAAVRGTIQAAEKLKTEKLKTKRQKLTY